MDKNGENLNSGNGVGGNGASGSGGERYPQASDFGPFGHNGHTRRAEAGAQSGPGGWAGEAQDSQRAQWGQSHAGYTQPHQTQPHQGAQVPRQEQPHQAQTHQAQAHQGAQPRQHPQALPHEPGYPPQAGAGEPGENSLNAPPKEKKRWSTGAVAALMVGAVVLASGTTFALSAMQGTNSTRSVNTLDSAPTGNEDTSSSRLEESGTIAQVADKVTRSVVQIQVQTARGGEEGSGSIFTNDGMILTNNHVVGAAAEGNAKMQVITADGRVLPAKFIAADPQTDIAFIKAEGADNLQPMAMGDSNAINVGETVAAIGSPLGLNSTVTSGIVSAKDRPVQAAGEDGGEGSLIDAIQTDAAINPGNSGGALVNLKGELVGIPTVIATLGGGGTSGSIGLGFAIPSNQAVRIAKQLIDNGKATHPMIGAQINTASRYVGAEVMEVNPGSPAEKAGLEKGDVVRKVDDRLIDTGVGLIAAIRSHEVGDTVKLTVLPGGRGPEKQLDVTLGTEAETQE